MDPNANDCIDALTKRLGKFTTYFDTDSVRSRIIADWTQYSATIIGRNKKLLDVNPNTKLTYFDDFVRSQLDDILIDTVRGSRTNMIMELKFAEQIKSIEDNVKFLEKLIPDRTDKKGFKTDQSKLRYQVAYNSFIYNTNKTYGHATVEGLLDAETKGITGSLLYRLKQEFPEAENLVKLVKEVNDKEFFDEYFHLIDNYDANKNTILTNEKTHKIAKIILEEVAAIPFYKLIQLGRFDTRPFTNRLRIAFETSKIKKFKDAEEFGNFFAPLLSNKHGDDFQKLELARNIYKNFHEDNQHDWRSVDRAVQDSYDQQVRNIKNKYVGNPSTEAQSMKNREIAQVPNVINYKDGAAFIKARDNLGIDTNMTTLLYRSINESGRLLGLTRAFGPNHQQGFDRLYRYVKEKTNDFQNGNLIEDKISRHTAEYMNHLIHPYITENSYLSVWGNSLRSLENVKLGSGLLTQLGDMSTFVYSGLIKADSTFGRLVASIFNSGDEFRGTKAERQAYNGMILDFSEMFVASNQDRFRMNDNYGASANSSMLNGFSRFSSTMSHIALEWTGFNWWNRSMGAGAAAVVSREIGDDILNNVDWNKLNAARQANYTRFGIFEKEFNELKARRPLDDNNRLNIFALRDEISADLSLVGVGLDISRTPKLEINSASLQNKLIMMINDLVEKMVIKPGALDRATVSFFRKPGSVSEQFFKSIMQFKSYMVSFSRKLVLAEYYKNDKNYKNYDVALKLAGLYAMVYGLSYLTVQGKQYVAGKQPYTAEEAAWKAMAYSNMVPIIGDFLWENGGASLWNSTFGDGKEPAPTLEKFMENLAGPVIGDFLKLSLNAVNTARGAVLDIRDLENDQIWRQHLSKFTQTAGGLIPFYHMWQTQLLWRSQLHDRLSELINPRGYRKYQRDQERKAREQRSGGELYSPYGKLFRSE